MSVGKQMRSFSTSRRIIGWAFSANLMTRVVLDALDMALVIGVSRCSIPLM
jgi:hypothetical protein